jgi:hypothetical protein
MQGTWPGRSLKEALLGPVRAAGGGACRAEFPRRMKPRSVVVESARQAGHALRARASIIISKLMTWTRTASSTAIVARERPGASIVAKRLPRAAPAGAREGGRVVVVAVDAARGVRARVRRQPREAARLAGQQRARPARWGAPCGRHGRPGSVAHRLPNPPSRTKAQQRAVSSAAGRTTSSRCASNSGVRRRGGRR